MATIAILAVSACILLAWWLAIRSEEKAFYKRLEKHNIRLNDRRSNKYHATAKRPAHSAEREAAGDDGKRTDCGAGNVVRETYPQADQCEGTQSG